MVAQNSTSWWSRKRHAYLERVRHRCAVEVVQHVVDECQLPVEVQESSGAGASETPSSRARTASRRLTVPSRRQGAAEQRRPRQRPSSSDRSQQALDGVVRAASVRAAPPETRTGPRGRGGRPGCGSSARKPDPRRRRRVHSVLGSRKSSSAPCPDSATVTCSRGELAEARNPSAERSAMGSSRCQTRSSRSIALVGRAQLQLVMIGTECVRHETCIGELVRVGRAGEADGRMSSPAPTCCAPSGRRSGSSRCRRSASLRAARHSSVAARTDSSRRSSSRRRTRRGRCLAARRHRLRDTPSSARPGRPPRSRAGAR